MILLKRTTLFLVAALFAVFAASCSSDDVDGPGDPETDYDLRSMISHKWIVSGTTGIQSIEFNRSGSFILIGNLDNLSRTASQETYYGDYTISSEAKKQVDLDGLGFLTIESVGDNKLKFTLTRHDSNYSFTADKASEMASSTKTNLLSSTTWIFVKGTENGMGMSADNTLRLLHMRILFSKAGTYYAHVPNDISSLTGTAKWKWDATSGEKKFLYSWDRNANPALDTYKSAEITELTNNQLVIKETQIIMDYTYVYVFTYKPYVAGK